MTDFEKWFYTEDAEKFGLCPDIHSARAAWNYQETKLKEMDEVIKLQDTDLRKYEKQIDELKAQLNNMEACYIEKKKQVEAVEHQKSLQELEISQISQANQEWQKINGELAKALRGAND